ncbi:hypothetical protein [Methylomonas koyamae]|uniref:hypothetical protein n=1 Tax=Methylomonas koyamae TaxID=702114 RepID=UPI00287339C2|nr:hypothetical protein [Methylomonas koyamae]WNB77578.1 hypothetical protein RI210_08340 [Methylomonas koyamae]
MQTIACNGELTITGTATLITDASCSGSWVAVGVGEPFNPATLDPSAVVGAIGSGFIVAGIPLLVVLLGRIVLEQIRGSNND